MIPDVSGQPLWVQAIAGVGFLGVVALVVATLPPVQERIERWRDRHDDDPDQHR